MAGHTLTKPFKITAASLAAAITLSLAAITGQALGAAQQQTGSVGLQGTVPGNPPAQAPTIGVPTNGQNFSNIPITVSGLCPNNTLVEVYKNGVFSGAAECQGGSYSLQIDLFDGRNDLVARVYDNLNQAGPDSATVTVYYNPPVGASGPQLVLTTQYSKRGGPPGSLLSWPITLSGGSGPYAISVNWGDKTAPDLISQPSDGNLNLGHTYVQSGVYKVTVRASDSKGNTAFLQLVGIGNGPVQQSTGSGSGIITQQQTKVLWWPVIVLFVLTLLSFWLGGRQQLAAIKARLRNGDAPF